MVASHVPRTLRALVFAVFAILPMSCAGTMRDPRLRIASARGMTAPVVPTDPLIASGVLRAPGGAPPVRVLGGAMQDGELVLHASSDSSAVSDAKQKATLMFAWARPFLHPRRIHALRVVIHMPSGPRLWRFGLDALHGWRRRDEAAGEADRRLGPFPPAEMDAGDEVDARAAAEAWLALVDASSYDEALQAAPRLLDGASAAEWASYLRALPGVQESRRAPFALHAARLDDLTGGPFVLLMYVTVTPRGGLHETLALERGPKGWHVVSYDAHELGWSDFQLEVGFG